MRRAVWWPVVLLWLASCGAPSASPEEQVRAVLGRAEEAVEASDSEAFMALLAEHYRDAQGHTRQTAGLLLAGYLQQNRSIHLFTRVDSLVVSDTAGARVNLLVAMTGHPVEDAGALALARAAVYRFDLTLVEVQPDDWQVRHAAWQRATPAAFF